MGICRSGRNDQSILCTVVWLAPLLTPNIIDKAPFDLIKSITHFGDTLIKLHILGYSNKITHLGDILMKLHIFYVTLTLKQI